jgi:CRISPR/Cas system CMR-associated protein Cmr1 (group 7 of RAMP superfamily)
MAVRNQEALIFGSTAGDEGNAGKLIVRVSSVQVQSAVRDGQEIGHPNFSDPAYLTFPIQSREKMGKKTTYAGRGVLLKGSFELCVIWRGDLKLWSDILALIAVFGHLGSIGFRGRRAMGALAFTSPNHSLVDALEMFNSSKVLLLKEITNAKLNSSRDCISALGKWLKSWREHGRTPNLAVNQPGFDWARRDHNEGSRLIGSTVTQDPPGHGPKGKKDESFRAALGLPIVQYFSSAPKGRPNTVMWDWEWDPQKNKGQGRFASPVLLRPHKDAQGNWHALVIFIEAHKWPENRQVHLSCGDSHETRRVSLDLYNEMKKDSRLKPFP